MDFKKYLKENAQRVEKELDEILSKFLSETKKLSPKLLPLAKAFINSCQGGKRIRGVLVKLGYELRAEDGSRKPEDILKIGAALEILHTAILIHDDIMDKSPFRRGQPSLYKSVGIDQAIALGDLGFFLSLQIICQSSFPAKEKNKALQLFSKVMVDTAIGQIMDVEKDDPMIVAKLKTAQYTISAPLILGTILAGAENKYLSKFGENLGIAFQIQDDILDGEALDQSLAQVLEYAAGAKKVVPKITSDPGLRQLLMSMIDYMIERTQ